MLVLIEQLLVWLAGRPANIFRRPAVHIERSYGCASYLIRRPEGNVLVDVPRFVPKLVDRIKASVASLRFSRSCLLCVLFLFC